MFQSSARHGHRLTDSISVFVSELTPEELSRADIQIRKSLNLSELTADIVAAFVANNALPIAELPALDSIRACGTGEACKRVGNFRPAGRKKGASGLHS